ncbi:putative pentatricopeptide repeat-containing protein At3g15200 [Magnolia sinica]|uniref:putative pentatricopeptide repeat-containing protein At3g15200 n=1 Tax=Magnolia sinica TaxID=86752 RepID=UPI0026588835|nr:putative pentatricopeptide repeat-containing protein At3g15200 [Magnolia sinica]
MVSRVPKTLLHPSFLYYRSCFIDEHHSLKKIFPFLRRNFMSHIQDRFGRNCTGTNKENYQFWNITFPSHAPYQNLYIERDPNSSTEYDEYPGSSSHAEVGSMPGSDNLVLRDDPSISKDAVMIQNLLKVHQDPAKLKSALYQCGLSVTENLVIEVLQRHRSDWCPAFLFFNWASGQKGYSHGSRALNEMLDILGRMKQFELMRKLIDEIPQEKRTSLVTERTFAILLNRYASGHKVEEAIEMFYKREEFGLKLDNTAFHTLLMSLCRYKHVAAAESLFLLKQDEFTPDIKSRNIILNGWCVLGSLREAKRFWNDIIISRCKPDLFTYGIFINSLTKAGKLSRAVELFTAMWKKGCPPDVAICNCIIDGLCFKKRVPDALTIFGEMNEHGCLPNVATYNSLIKHLCKIRRMEKAYELLDEMEQKGCPPNTRTFGYFFKSMKKPEEVPGLLERMERSGCRLMGDTYNLILKLYIEWNHLEGIQSMWVEMEKNGMGPDQRSYTIMIHGFYNNGRMDEALRYFAEMTLKGMIPEPRTELLIKAIELKQETNGSLSIATVKDEKKRGR